MPPAEIYLVDGCPGGGLRKTRYLSEQAARAVERWGSRGVAIASLTRAAAHEIAARTNLDKDLVGTLHSHAYHALDRPALAETPEGIAEWNGAHPSLALAGGARTIEDAPVDADNDGRSHASLLHAQITNHRARLTQQDQWTPEQQDHHALWADFKQQTGRLDWTDLTEKAITEIDAHPAIPEVLLLDEAQDFSALELRLALQWAKHTRTTVICGDLDQAIYAFRGADPEAFARLELTDRRTLSQSYRCPAAVRDLAREWMAGNDMPTEPWEPREAIKWPPGRNDETIDLTPAQGSVDSLPIALRRPDALVEHLATDIAEGHSPMVLAACAYQLAPLIAVLRDSGLPYHNPYRATQGAWNPMRGAAHLLAYLRHDDAVWGDQARTWTWNDLRLWVEPLNAKTAMPRGVKTLIESKCRKDEFGRTDSNAQVDLETVCRLLDVADTRHHPCFHGDIEWWATNLLDSQRRPNQYAIDLYRRDPATLTQWAATLTGQTAATDLPWAVVGTIHSVKGGAADHVYLAPDLSKQGMWGSWHGGGQARAQIVRMMYVAITRARQHVTILQPSSAEHIPLDHLGGDTTGPAPLPASERWAHIERKLAARAGAR